MYPRPPTGLGSRRGCSTGRTARLPEARTDRGVGRVCPLLRVVAPACGLPRAVEGAGERRRGPAPGRCLLGGGWARRPWDARTISAAVHPAHGRGGSAAAWVCASGTRGACVRIYRAAPGASPRELEKSDRLSICTTHPRGESAGPRARATFIAVPPTETAGCCSLLFTVGARDCDQSG